MNIVSEDRSSVLTLELLEVEPQYHPSLNLFACVADKGYCGETDVWIGEDALQLFLFQLKQCEKTRKGQAMLRVQDELVLTIEQRDGWGHFQMHYKISRLGWYKNAEHLQCVTGEFDLDAELFSQLTTELSRLLSIE